VAAAGALVHHLRTTQKVDLAHVRAITYRPRADALLVDPTTLEHLEIIEGADGDRHGSLLDELDRTVTSIGSRLMRSWLLRPLVTLEPIRDRLDAVEELAFLTTDRGKFRDAIKGVQDLERLLARAALGTAGPRDLVGLKLSLGVIPRVRAVLNGLRAPLVCSLLAELDDLSDVRDDIDRTLVDEPPALAREGGFTRDGRDGEIDDLRRISRSGKLSRNRSSRISGACPDGLRPPPNSSERRGSMPRFPFANSMPPPDASSGPSSRFGSSNRGRHRRPSKPSWRTGIGSNRTKCTRRTSSPT